MVNRIRSIPFYFVDPAKEFWKTNFFFQPFPIPIYILPEEANLLHTHLSQVLHLFDNVSTGSALFPSPDIRNNAEGAEVITPLHDGDIGLYVIQQALEEGWLRDSSPPSQNPFRKLFLLKPLFSVRAAEAWEWHGFQ